MKWREDPAVREGYASARVGPLFAYVEGNGGYQKPGHPDHEPERFNWFIAPDDKDKNDRRAIAQGCEESMEVAKREVELALGQIVDQMREELHYL